MAVTGNETPTEHDGQVLIIVAVASVVLILFLALAVDAGLALSERRGAQNAADAASMAVARAMIDGVTDESVLRGTAVHYADLNGYDIEDPANAVQFPEGPDGTIVEVIVRHDIPRVFLGAFYDGDWSVSAAAAAALETVPKDYALLTLKENGPGVNLIGNVDIEIEGGGAMSNSSMECRGNTLLHADQNVDAHQGFSTTGNCEFVGETGSNPSAPKVDDPLEGTPGPPKPPYPSGLEEGECNKSGTSVTCTPGHYGSTESFNGNLDITFLPGRYHFDNADLSLRGNISMTFRSGDYSFYMERGDIEVRGNSDVDMDPHDQSELFFYFDRSSITFQGNTSLNMASGIYYFDGEDFGVSGNQRVTGDDLLFYFDNDASFNHAGNAEFDFTASPTPLYDGMPENLLFFSAPGSTSKLDLRGNSGINFRGITYMPDGMVDFRGNPDGVWATGQVIVKEVEFRGNANGVIQYENMVEIGVPGVWLVR